MPFMCAHRRVLAYDTIICDITTQDAAARSKADAEAEHAGRLCCAHGVGFLCVYAYGVGSHLQRMVE